MKLFLLICFFALPCVAQELVVGGEYRLYRDNGKAHICRIAKWLGGDRYEANERSGQLPTWGPAECVDSKGRPIWPRYKWKKEIEVINLAQFGRVVLIRKPNGDKPDRWTPHIWNTPWIPPSERIINDDTTDDDT